MLQYGARQAEQQTHPANYVPLARLDAQGQATEQGGLGTVDDARSQTTKTIAASADHISARGQKHHQSQQPAANDTEAQYWEALNAQAGTAQKTGADAKLCDVYYFHTDQVGMPQELTNAQGQLVWQASYKTWGSTVSEEWEVKSLTGQQVHSLDQGDIPTQEESQQQNLRFQGQYLDRETGLHYNTFRYYDADVGRFICPDPIGLSGGMNLGSYAPNPNTWIDPWGWACWSTARKNTWKSEATNATLGKYSARNISRMQDGKAPRMKVEVKYKDTAWNRARGRVGQTRQIDVPMEIHHQHIPQRAGSKIANENWNLTKATPWGHASMDGYRNTGWDLVRITKTISQW